MDEKKRVHEASIHNFIDQHLREIKWVSYGVGSVAVIILFRSIRAMKKFVHPSQIPNNLVENATSLHGIVRDVTEEGFLRIEHIPIFEFKALSFLWRSGNNWKGLQYIKFLNTKNTSFLVKVLLFEMLSEQGKCLTIKPAGIVMTKSGIEWIQSNTLDKHAWFQMFYRDIDTLHCDVQIKRRYFGSSICQELIRLGLCKIENFEWPPDGKDFNEYLMKLIAIEQKASMQDKGIWKEEKKRHYIWNKISKSISNVWSKIPKVFKSKDSKGKR